MCTTIDYSEWNRVRNEKTYEIADSAVDRIRDGETISPLSLVPELSIKEEEPYTVWIPQGSPESYTPKNDLRNLEALYTSKKGKIIIPLHAELTRSVFEYKYGMRVETLAGHIEENPDHLRPIIMYPPKHYRKIGYLDGVLKVSKEVLGGEFPPNPYNRFIIFMNTWSGELDTKDFIECHADANALFDIDSRKSLNRLSKEGREVPDHIINRTEGMIVGQRVFGFSTQTSLCLNIAREMRDPGLGLSLLGGYQRYLIDPIAHYLGGFVNYNLNDIRKMAFLRLFELMKEELGKVKEVLLQSPAARSIVLMQDEKRGITVLRGGNVDLKSLNTTIELAEKYEEVGKRLADYHSKASRLDLDGANEAVRALNEVLNEQYFDEFVEWMMRETDAKIAKGFLDYGSCLITWPPILLSQLPTEWKLLLIPAIEWFKKKLYKKVGILDTKEIVEKLWRVRNWPMVQKGIPYLIWRVLKT